MKNIHARIRFISITTITLFLLASILPLTAAAGTTVNVWWPTTGATVTGTQPFKAMVPGIDVSQYDMFWQVDGGGWNSMQSSYTDYPHKEASVSLTSWTWHGAGPYTVNFIARQNGVTIAQQSVTIYTGSQPAPVVVQPMVAGTMQAATATTPSTNVAPASATPTPVTVSAPAPSPTPAPAPAPTLAPLPAPLSTFYVNPHSSAAAQASQWASSNPTGAAAMQTLAAQPTASWFGDWNSNVQNDVHAVVSAAQAQNATAVLVAYNIPQRDCGSYSAGGATASTYSSWIRSFAAGIGSGKAVVILEPDSLSLINCLSSADQQTRLSLLSDAVNVLKSNGNTKVYIDAGHSGWISPATMASLLRSANVSRADGFATNVSNFMPTTDEVSYGSQVSAQLGGSHFVVDTSRNGNGTNGQWCNPSGRAIGQKPTTATGNALVDAYLWIKTPGESDGSCNGGPNAGVWWSDYALGLVQNAH